jgi:hypothetical protein
VKHVPIILNEDIYQYDMHNTTYDIYFESKL